jgi:hypothetical protein
MKAALRAMVLFGVSDPLIGDVAEASAKRSRLWLWTQAFSAVVRTVVNATFQQPGVAAGVVASTLASVLIVHESALRLYLWALNLPLLSAGYSTSKDYVVPHHPRLFLYVWHVYALPLDVAWCVGAFAGGMIALRFVRQNRSSFALVAAVAQVPFTLWWGLPILFRLHEAITVYHLPMRFASGWVFEVSIILIGIPLCILLGGMFDTSDALSRR